MFSRHKSRAAQKAQKYLKTFVGRYFSYNGVILRVKFFELGKDVSQLIDVESQLSICA